MSIRCLLVDNYDSYTYNLFQLLSVVGGGRVDVVRNDAVSWEDLRPRIEAGDWHCVVLSPGPGTPDRASDVGVCVDVLRHVASVPVLGVCLGHQALAAAHGARVVRAPEPVHGRLSLLEHAGHPLFAGVPPSSPVVRYHSLVVDAATLPAELTAIAHCTRETYAPRADPAGRAGADPGERLVMALAHRTRPHVGVQFHPESVLTSHGPRMVENFLRMAAAFWGGATVPALLGVPAAAGAMVHRSALEEEWAQAGCRDGSLGLCYRKVAGVLGAVGGSGNLFWRLFGGEEPRMPGTGCFWLDSAAADRGRFSFMGARGGPLWRRWVYWVPRGEEREGRLEVTDGQGRVSVSRGPLLGSLKAALGEARVRWGPGDAAALPFDFWGGFVGYLGYEMHAECMEGGGPQPRDSGMPDAALVFADRLVAVDHREGDVYAVAVHDGSEAGRREAEAYVEEACEAVGRLAGENEREGERAGTADAVAGTGMAPLRLRHPRQRYLANVEACREALAAGESYEVCLTTALEGEVPGGAGDSGAEAGGGAPSRAARALYRQLRARNPAPYAALLSLRGGAPEVCCSSPERFLKLCRGGWVEARPIKGTAPRDPSDPDRDALSASTLRDSEKDRAENLMIVDLLRNDLGRVCRVGTVHVPGIMEIQSFATVHQMVSTVVGVVRPGASAVDCVRAAFPGGSMTGAPKARTLAVIDDLEGAARGVYSGALGYFSTNGTMDLNIVIRTAVLQGRRMIIGAGGAVVWQSDSAAEYEEMRVKARAVVGAVGAAFGEGGVVRVDDGKG